MQAMFTSQQRKNLHHIRFLSFPRISQAHASSDFEFSSIQCAQRQPSYSYLHHTDTRAASARHIPDDVVELDVSF